VICILIIWCGDIRDKILRLKIFYYDFIRVIWDDISSGNKAIASSDDVIFIYTLVVIIACLDLWFLIIIIFVISVQIQKVHAILLLVSIIILR
jgi:hypothetical protein